MTQQTVNVEGMGSYTADVHSVARFEGMTKKEVVAQIAGWTKNESEGKGVAFWRNFPKETLVVVAADMFGAALRTAGQAAADMEPVQPATDTHDFSGQTADEADMTDDEKMEVKMAGGSDSDTRHAEALRQDTPESVVLTSLEAKVFAALRQNALDVAGGDFGILEEVNVKTLDITKQQFGGVVTSLQTKGMISYHPTVVNNDQHVGQFEVSERAYEVKNDQGQTSGDAPIAADSEGVWVLKSGDSYLRRDQPRKPGETAKYRFVTLDKASRYKTQRQAITKIAEVVVLCAGVDASAVKVDA